MTIHIRNENNKYYAVKNGKYGWTSNRKAALNYDTLEEAVNDVEERLIYKDYGDIDFVLSYDEASWM